MFIILIYCCYVFVFSVLVVIKFVKIVVIFVMILVLINVGIIGIKILEMFFNIDLILEGFCFDFCVVFIFCVCLFIWFFLDVEEFVVVVLVEGSFFFNFMFVKLIIFCVILFIFLGLMMIWSCLFFIMLSIFGIVFNFEIFIRLLLMIFICI